MIKRYRIRWRPNSRLLDWPWQQHADNRDCSFSEVSLVGSKLYKNEVWHCVRARANHRSMVKVVMAMVKRCQPCGRRKERCCANGLYLALTILSALHDRSLHATSNIFDSSIQRCVCTLRNTTYPLRRRFFAPSKLKR
jgi:hypothetical protein